MSRSNSELAVIDSGGANIGSVLYALRRIGVDTGLTSDSEQIRTARRVLLPGVGAADQAMTRLRQHGLVEVIRDLTQPVLGICVGMQLLFDSSTESGDDSDVDCLGVIPGRVERLKSAPGIRVPHMGWNALSNLNTSSPLMRDINEGEYSYFVHSYAAPVSAHTVATARHGLDFSAMVSHNNFHGAQFHPERSARTGQQLLTNFMAMEA